MKCIVRYSYCKFICSLFELYTKNTMENSQNFRITLHLTHFFQDYRSISKIFVNSKMKCIADLENHVRQIFDLEKFYFISNGHFIPSTEDIRILQQDDVVIAIPYEKTGNIHINTSISIGSSNISHTKRKRIKGIGAEETVQNIDCNTDDGKSKKTKKKKKIKLDVHDNDSLENIEEPNCVDAKISSPQKQHSAKLHKKHKKTSSLDISNFAEAGTQNFDENKQKENAVHNNCKYQNVYDNEEFQENTKDDSNSSVQDKITYFEKHLYVSGSKSNENQFLANDTVNYKTSQQIISNSIEEKKEASNFLQKKLYIQKRSKDLISYDLPKKSNVVKSIVVSNNHSNNGNITEAINNNTVKFCQTPLQDSIERKYKTFMTTLQSTLVDRSTSKTNSSGATNTEIKEKSMPELVFSQIKEKQTEINESRNNLSTSDTIITKDELNYCEIGINVDDVSRNQLVNDVKHAISVSEGNQILEHTTPQDVANTTKSLNNNFEILDNIKISREIDSAIHSENTSTPGSIRGSISYSEREASLQKECESISDRQDEDIEYFETPSFVTKRRRKRSHRKRKSKTNVERESLPNTAENSYKKVPQISTKPALHIKFNDDDEVCTVLENGTKIVENCLEEKSFEPMQDINGTENLSSTEQLTRNVTTNILGTIIHIEETPKHSTVSSLKHDVSDNITQNEKAYENIDSSTNSCNNNPTTILRESMEHMKKPLACSTPLISHDTILKSPLMTSIKPKNRDIIAFKIFRLAHDYSPEISKYIIGEVQSYDDQNANLEINIIDGLDQCKEPDSGKFSIEPLNEDCNNVKSFCWNSLIEPRLIFP